METGFVNRNQLGLTLLELLISLLLLVMISTAVASATGYAVRVFDRSQIIQNQSEQLHHRTLLRDWILRADPTRASHFYGTANEFAFQARSDTALAWDSGQLMIRVTSGLGRTDLLLLGDNGTPLLALPLSKQDLQLRYYGQQNGQTRWHDNWIEQNCLPVLVRITGPDPQTWPDFIAMPNLSVD